jgi:hypothetical protein
LQEGASSKSPVYGCPLFAGRSSQRGRVTKCQR